MMQMRGLALVVTVGAEASVAMAQALVTISQGANINRKNADIYQKESLAMQCIGNAMQ
jgi:hypothetical protein